MDIGKYRKYLEQVVNEAIRNSDGTNAGISEYLSTVKPAGRFTPNRDEKNQALQEARKVFDEHRHWPLGIILSFLGIENTGQHPN